MSMKSLSGFVPLPRAAGFSRKKWTDRLPMADRASQPFRLVSAALLLLEAMAAEAVGAKVGRGAVIRPSARVTYPWKTQLGAYCWIGDHAEIYSLDEIRIGEHAVVSQRSYLCAGTHDASDVTFPLRRAPISVEAEAWVATDCFIAPGITIGAGSIIGARSSVFSDIPPGVVAVGHPAKIVRSRKPSEPPSLDQDA